MFCKGVAGFNETDRMKHSPKYRYQQKLIKIKEEIKELRSQLGEETNLFKQVDLLVEMKKKIANKQEYEQRFKMLHTKSDIRI